MTGSQLEGTVHTLDNRIKARNIWASWQERLTEQDEMSNKGKGSIFRSQVASVPARGCAAGDTVQEV